jgi:hypothetical protein
MLDFVPLVNMSFKNKLIAIANLIMLISVIFSLIYRNLIFVLFGIILLIFLFYINLHHEKVKIDTHETLTDRNLSIVDNKICVKPSLSNPFMNPNVVDYNNINNDIKSCPYDNTTIKDNIDAFFKQDLYKDINDIFENNFSKRQFYTVPATTIPNDRQSFQDWLYYRDKSCKENNGFQCYNNIM